MQRASRQTGSVSLRWHDPVRINPVWLAEGLPACFTFPASQWKAWKYLIRLWWQGTGIFLPRLTPRRAVHRLIRHREEKWPIHANTSLCFIKLLSSYLNLSCKTLNWLKKKALLNPEGRAGWVFQPAVSLLHGSSFLYQLCHFPGQWNVDPFPTAEKPELCSSRFH